MQTLMYKIIKSQKQYDSYCTKLEQLVQNGVKNKEIKDEIELLTLIIQKWDTEHNSFDELDPISLLKHLMTENGLKQKDLVEILCVSKGLVSDILSYKKGLSKEIIRTLATHFCVSQEAFNRPYKLILSINSHLRDASVMNTIKELAVV